MNEAGQNFYGHLIYNQIGESATCCIFHIWNKTTYPVCFMQNYPSRDQNLALAVGHMIHLALFDITVFVTLQFVTA